MVSACGQRRLSFCLSCLLWFHEALRLRGDECFLLVNHTVWEASYPDFNPYYLKSSHIISVKVLVTQSCRTLCDPMDCSLPGCSVHGILQARILEWVAISFSRGTSWPRDQTRVSWITHRFFTIWAIREAIYYLKVFSNKILITK